MNSNNTVNSNNVTHNITNIYYVNQMPTGGGSPAVNSFINYGTAPAVSDKNKSAALLLCFFLGFLGGHLFYAGRWKKGLLYLFSCGLFGIGWLIDIFVIAANKFTDSYGLPITGNAVWGKRLIYLTIFLNGFTLIAGSTQTDETGPAGMLITAVFGFLFILSLIRGR